MFATNYRKNKKKLSIDAIFLLPHYLDGNTLANDTLSEHFAVLKPKGSQNYQDQFYFDKF